MSSSFDELRSFMFSKVGRAGAVIGFTSSNTDCVHGIFLIYFLCLLMFNTTENLKLFEAETGIVTLHCTKRVIDQVSLIILFFIYC